MYNLLIFGKLFHFCLLRQNFGKNRSYHQIVLRLSALMRHILHFSVFFVFAMRNIYFFIVFIAVICLAQLRIRIPMSPLGQAVKRVSADAIERKNYLLYSRFLFQQLSFALCCVWFCCCCCRVTKPLTFCPTHLLHYCARQPPTSVSAKHSSIPLSYWFYLLFLLTFRFYYLFNVFEQTLSRQLHTAVMSIQMLEEKCEKIWKNARRTFGIPTGVCGWLLLYLWHVAIR